MWYQTECKCKKWTTREKKESMEILAQEQKIVFSVCLFDGQTNIKMFMFIWLRIKYFHLLFLLKQKINLTPYLYVAF